jgi:small-conductance mechanosensitive channel
MASQGNGGSASTPSLDGAADLLPEGAPSWLSSPEAVGAMALVAAAVAAVVLHRIIFLIVGRFARGERGHAAKAMSRRLRKPALLALVLLAVQIPLAQMEGAVDPSWSGLIGVARHAASILIIATIVWLLIRLLLAGEDVVDNYFRLDVQDNLRARQVHTQMVVLRRVVTTLLIIVGGAAILMTFPRARQLGTSLLASAGIAGIVIGLAARPTVTNLIAGVQIAFTRPINLDDVVIMEGEWGRIEQITTTYVVVKVWDDRRLIVPLSRILEQPFQNWTRKTSQLLGTVFLYTDYAAPLEGMRAELKRLCEESGKWDGRVCLIQITDATERAMQVRALVSAKDAGTLWDLRCFVREGLIRWLSTNHPESLPRLRAEVEEESGTGGGEPVGAGGPETA